MVNCISTSISFLATRGLTNDVGQSFGSTAILVCVFCCLIFVSYFCLVGCFHFADKVAKLYLVPRMVFYTPQSLSNQRTRNICGAYQ